MGLGGFLTNETKQVCKDTLYVDLILEGTHNINVIMNVSIIVFQDVTKLFNTRI